MKLEGVILQEDNVAHRDVGLWSGPLLSRLQRLDIGSVPDVLELFSPGDKLVCHIFRCRFIPCSACYPELLEETLGLNQGRRIPA